MNTAVQEQTPTGVDGRTARRDRNREAVLDAVLALFAEDNPTPSVQQVADRSGVSLRSVYRYYDDQDTLVREAIARNVEMALPYYVVEGLGEGPLQERIERIVERRVVLYDVMAPVARAAMQRAPFNDLIRQQVETSRQRLRQQVEQMFEPELRGLDAERRDDLAVSLDVLLGFASLEHLRRHRGLTASDTRRVLGRALAALLGTT